MHQYNQSQIEINRDYKKKKINTNYIHKQIYEKFTENLYQNDAFLNNMTSN